MLGLVLLAPLVNASAQAPSTQPKDPLLGTWTINLEKSKLPGKPPKSHYRTFDLGHDGMVLCTNGTVGQDGQVSFGFWEAKLDGSEGREFNRARGATPSALVYMKRVDPYKIEIRATREGKLFAQGAFTLSKDGRMLTQALDMTNERGEKSTMIRVYDKVGPVPGTQD
jgi:hypothetical protein